MELSTNSCKHLGLGLILTLVIGLCAPVNNEMTETNSNTENDQDGLLLNSTDAGNDLSHTTVTSIANGTNPETDTISVEGESAYFISELFRKYGNSKELSLNGFARLLCSLGLIPPFAETTNVADDTQYADDHNSDNTRGKPDCKQVTFLQIQAIFDDAAKRLEHNHKDEEHHDHGHEDGHSDHDHQPNRNVDSAQTNGGGDNHHVHDHESSRSDHDHDHDYHDHDNHIHDNGHHDDHDHSTVEGDNTTVESSHNVHSSSQNQGRTRSISNSKAQGATVKRRKRETLPASSSAPSNHHIPHSQCMSPQDLLQHFHIPLSNLTASNFASLCPALLYGIDSDACHKAFDQHNHDHDNDEVEKEGTFSEVPAKVWGFSTVAVLLISLAGLLGVAVVPIMQKVFYNHMLQFLVAVAVGALSGDALLHLLPHAIANNLAPSEGSHVGHGREGHDEYTDDNHLEAVWKGLVGLLCIFFFFLIERVLTIVTEKKRRRKAMSRQKNKRCERLCDKEKTGGVGAKLAAHEEGDFSNCEQMVMVVHPNRALKGYADATHEVMLHQCDEKTSQAEQGFIDNNDDQDHPLATFGHSHSHGHGHGHGHTQCDTVPGSVAAVAWMVILGDGIHNFSDGLAIGVAFSNSVTGGFSTSIAVLCHELPHEIGDFAVLLRAGMSIKQAVVYNCVSSVLCFIGMLVGVAIGNIHKASLWVFAGVAGMFLYISMVDMLPEMTAVDTKKGENQYLHLLLQVCGMLLGAGIMLIIAVYEHDLQRSLG